MLIRAFEVTHSITLVLFIEITWVSVETQGHKGKNLSLCSIIMLD